MAGPQHVNVPPVDCQMSCSMFCTCDAGADCNTIHARITLSHDDENKDNDDVKDF